MKNQKLLLSFIIAAAFLLQKGYAQQHVWRVNNNSAYNQWSGHQVFSELQQAINSNAVISGDTLYVEASATAYAAATITNKKLTIIGTGYFLDQNTGLQNVQESSTVVNITFGAGSSGSKISGIKNTGGSGSGYYFSNNLLSDITITRCFGYVAFVNNTLTQLNNIKINQSYVTINMGASNVTNLAITNNYIMQHFAIGTLGQGFAANNIIEGDVDLNGFKFYNNIVLGNQLYAPGNSSANVYNNIFTFAQPSWLSGGNNNFGFSNSQVFSTASTTSDGQFHVKPPNQCPECYQGFPFPTGTGVEVGMYGGLNPASDGYRLSGIPNIPTISSLQSQGSVSVPTISVNIVTKSNN